MNNNLISRSALLEKQCCGRISGEDVRNAPAVDAEPVRHGRWIVKCEMRGDPYDDGWWEEWKALCSECGRMIYLDEYECANGNIKKEIAEFPYCHCGAKMDGE